MLFSWRVQLIYILLDKKSCVHRSRYTLTSLVLPTTERVQPCLFPTPLCASYGLCGDLYLYMMENTISSAVLSDSALYDPVNVLRSEVFAK